MKLTYLRITFKSSTRAGDSTLAVTESDTCGALKVLPPRRQDILRKSARVTQLGRGQIKYPDRTLWEVEKRTKDGSY